MLKYFIKVLVRNILKIFCILPIDKKKIFFESYQGKQISCNPYYIYKYIAENYSDFKIVWCYNKEPVSELKQAGVKFVKSMSIPWIIEELTSYCLISNMNFRSFIPYRKNQILINTWHGGGAYKKTDMEDNAQIMDYDVRKIQEYASKHLTCFLSSSEVLSKNKNTSKGIPFDKFLPVGMPRNDLFFDEKKMIDRRNFVRNIYGVQENDFVILYAPTFRGDVQHGSFKNLLDIKRIKLVFEKRFSKTVKIMFRGHHYLKNMPNSSDFDFDVSDYPDMQELICGVDSLITDYSSSMWDFSFTYKPCFLFMPDLEDYMTQRGFYTDPYSWGFPIAKSNEELEKEILNFNELDFKNKMENHHKTLGSYETGHATEKTVEYIINKIKG